MAMTLTGLTPVIYEALDTVAREQVGFVNSVNTDINADTVAIGQNVRSAVVGQGSAADIVPGKTAPNTGGQALTYRDVTITKSRAYPIQWTGEEQLSVNGQLARIMRDQFAQAFRTIGNEIEADIAAMAAANASRFVSASTGDGLFGTPGNFMDFANVNKALDDNGAPLSPRSLIVDSTAMANIRGKQSVLFKANEAGTDLLLREGIVGRVEGLDIRASKFATVNRTAGSGAGYLTAGALAAGTTVIPADTGTGTVLAGDIVSIGGVQYTVASALAAGSFTIAAPGLQGSVADNSAITLVSSGGANTIRGAAFARSAMQLLVRAPAMPQGGDAAADVLYVTDPVTGLVFQIAMYREYRQIHIEVGMAWGMAAFKPEFIVGLLG